MVMIVFWRLSRNHHGGVGRSNGRGVPSDALSCVVFKFGCGYERLIGDDGIPR